jgi:hypothetical protein
VPVEVVFVLGRWDQADLAVQPSVVEPVDVLGGGDLQVVDALPGALVADQLGLEQRVERLGQSVVIASPVLPTEATASASARRRVK